MEQKQPLQQMVLGQLDSYVQKMKLDHQLIPYTKINPRSTKDLNISHDNIKVLGKNIGRKISDISLNKIFTDMSPKARDIKERINTWDLIKLKSFCMAKEKNQNKQQQQNNKTKCQH